MTSFRRGGGCVIGGVPLHSHDPRATLAKLPRQFLGYSFPTVRQATAQALYIRFLEVPKLQKKVFSQPQGGPPTSYNWVFPKIGVFPPNHPTLIGFSIIDKPSILGGFHPPIFGWKHPTGVISPYL